MARYDPGRKQETRKAILKAAARAVRSGGPERVSVAAVMGEAGLTHGGFYAHFRSKEALVAAAIIHMFEGAAYKSARWTEGLNGLDALNAYVDRYLSPEHRDDPGRGCPLTTLAADVARTKGDGQAAFDAGVAGMIAAVAGRLVVDDGGEREALAASLVAEMAGAVALARAVSDPVLSDRLLDASRVAVKARAALARPPEAAR